MKNEVNGENNNRELIFYYSIRREETHLAETLEDIDVIKNGVKIISTIILSSLIEGNSGTPTLSDLAKEYIRIRKKVYSKDKDWPYYEEYELIDGSFVNAKSRELCPV